MQWYLVKLVFQILNTQGNQTQQFDEQIRLITADDYLHAFQKARLMGERESASLINQSTIPAKWKFIDVIELTFIEDLSDGIEIISTISEQENTESYIRTTQKTALHLLNKGINQFAQLN
ncbi:MAG: DUF4288 domain-containing protein [Chitinophagaceae bacterium]|nr:DUF4288 domain-containing protein [Chitinophagaceae bacterium]